MQDHSASWSWQHLFSMSQSECHREMEWGTRTFTLINLSSKAIVSHQCTRWSAALGFTPVTRGTFQTVLEGFFFLPWFVLQCARVHSSSWCSFWMHILLIGVHIIPAMLCVWSVLQYCCGAVITQPANLRGRWRVMNHKLISAAPLRSPNSSTRCS